MKTGAQLIAEERERQISQEGWSESHDDEHDLGELRTAAICYASLNAGNFDMLRFNPPTGWPWEREYWKPTESPVRNLVKAGALIAAEIDRLQRQHDREMAGKQAEWEAGRTGVW